MASQSKFNPTPDNGQPEPRPACRCGKTIRHICLEIDPENMAHQVAWYVDPALDREVNISHALLQGGTWHMGTGTADLRAVVGFRSAIKEQTSGE